jgi:hypothetical protein
MKSSPEMAHQNVCGFLTFGFFNFSDKCRKKHIKERCKNSKCKVKTCNLIHPKFVIILTTLDFVNLEHGSV